MISSETLAQLEFDKLLAEIERHLHSPGSVGLVRQIRPFGDPGQIRLFSGRVAELMRLENIGITLSLSHFDDIRPALGLLRPVGSVLSPQDLLLFIPVLRLFAELSRQISHRDDLPLIKSIAPQLHPFPELLEPLQASLDSDGGILDSASDLLRETRRAKRSLAGRIRKKIEEIIRNEKIEIFLQDDFITQRSGRWVIPVRMDSKGMVKGVVHDVSSSGETAFMEPLEIIPFVNELENLAAEERAEEIRILRQLSGWIRGDAAELLGCFETLMTLDLLAGVARFALEYRLETANCNETGELVLVDARHPLLMFMQKRGGVSRVEPLSLQLGGGVENAAVMVITGPNAGGKTIALKTAGILMLMALSGLPVPASPRSTFPFLDKLLVDIGDDQSIEKSHSTFSAHAARITAILRESGKRTLVLLDELGAGTEPLQGAAIACGVLNELRERGSLVIATTHLSDIIGFVHRSPRMINAGMAFDDATLTPLYRLIPGEPGESHALEIAHRFGMPESVITFARQMLGGADGEFASLMRELRQKRNDYDSLLRGIEAEQKNLARRGAEIEVRAAEVERLRREASEKGWSEARELISTTRRKMNSLLDELKQENRGEIVNRLRSEEASLADQLEPTDGESEALPRGGVKPGDLVQVRTLRCDGEVVSIDQRSGKIRVRAGRMELELALHELARAAGGKTSAKKPHHLRTWRTDLVESEERELKLIGMRVDEALAALEPFISRALNASIGEVRIIHGIGSGRLRDAVREELARNPLVEAFRPGEPHEGRDGATVVTLRG